MRWWWYEKSSPIYHPCDPTMTKHVVLPHRIGIDVDGVLCDFNHAYLHKLIDHTHIGQPDWNPVYDPNCWHWPTKYGYTEEHNSHVWSSISADDMYSDDFWGSLDVICSLEDYELLQDLHTHEDLYFVTNRPLTQKQTTESWLQEEMGLQLPTVLISDRKGHIAHGLNLQVFFDDKPENLLDIYRACGNSCALFLIDRPWNKDCTTPLVTRVSSIAEGMAKWQKQ
jgi:uncharacterized HAD superfamily protein